MPWRPYHRHMAYPIEPPIEPMLAKPTAAIPDGDGWIYEPKWDGFRALVFRDGDEVYVQSRDLKPLNRYFPELEEPLRAVGGPDARFVLDGEVVIARPDGGLDFDSLLLRIHPAASRVKMLAEESPGLVRRLRLPGRWRRRPARRARSRSDARASSGSSAIRPHRCGSRRRPPIRPWRSTGSRSSRAPGSTASSASGRASRTRRASARWRRSSTPAPPTAWSPASAGTRTGRAR